MWGSAEVVSGIPPIEIGQALAVSHLIGLAKENGDVRPIAVRECLRHLCGRCISFQAKASMAAILTPVQYGVATSAGLEQVVHRTRLAWSHTRIGVSSSVTSPMPLILFQEQPSFVKRAKIFPLFCLLPRSFMVKLLH